MFESTLRFGSLSAAVAGHLAIVFAIVVVTAFIVPKPPTPEPRDLEISFVKPPPLDLDTIRSDAPTPKKGTDSAKAAKTVTPPAPVEPPAPPDATPETLLSRNDAAPEGPDDSGDGTPGDPNGTELGVPGSPGAGGPGDPNGGGTEPVYVTGDMVAPRRLVRIEPIYPEVPRRARLGGRVTVTAVIGLDGNVESAEILSSTSPLFDRAALDAVKGWRYTPALMNGRPVRVYFTVVVDFSVR